MVSGLYIIGHNWYTRSGTHSTKHSLANTRHQGSLLSVQARVSELYVFQKDVVELGLADVDGSFRIHRYEVVPVVHETSMVVNVHMSDENVLDRLGCDTFCHQGLEKSSCTNFRAIAKLNRGFFDICDQNPNTGKEKYKMESAVIRPSLDLEFRKLFAWVGHTSDNCS